MLDALICGAGPAGSIAALTLARAGARVLLVDREEFPRDKLCGDTLNPGALSLLGALGLSNGPLAAAQPLRGMLVSGPRACVRAIYGGDTVGRAILRRDLDAWLLERAIAAGARFEPRLVARQPLIADVKGRPLVRGLVLTPRQNPSTRTRIPALITIAADGSRSALARAVGLAVAPSAPRRWAFGAYAAGVTGVGDVGEMHVRARHYIGIAPLGHDIANVCVVTGPRPPGRTPLDVIQRVLATDASLRPRFRRAAFLAKPTVLGPLAAERRGAGVPGLLLAGDAAGFIDPMTGDGLHLAIRGGLLAAEQALRAGETGDFAGAVLALEQARRQELGSKLKFNRALRRIVESPAAIGVASFGAILAPGVVRRLVNYAGDV
jgi:flavin-dependent dehydrogenase